MEEKDIHSIGDFIRIVTEDTKKWDYADSLGRPWFRGQTNKDYSPHPTIFRDGGYEEVSLTQMYRYRAGVLGDVPPRSGSIDEWLFLMQHYGVPTRMLDWTESGIVSLFFSVHEQDRIEYSSNAPNKENLNASKDGAVWLIHPLKLNGLTPEVGERFPNSWSDHKENRKVRANLQIPFGLKEAICDASEYPIAILTTFSKQVMSAQKSCFTVYGSRTDDLETMMHNKSLLKNGHFKKYIISAGDKPKIKQELDVLGVTHSMIFPDFQHLGIELKDRFRKISQ